ncbi:DNA replication protein psf2 [Tulasnella sp. 403]|nr:DNA replication protein psf2 [Tulasnella sp. 403]
MPFRFSETAKVLLDIAPDDIESPEQIHALLQEIREARQAKSREGLRMINHVHLRIRNITSMEINEIRSFSAKSMSILSKLAVPSLQSDGDDETSETATITSGSFSQLDDFSMDID